MNAPLDTYTIVRVQTNAMCPILIEQYHML